VPEPGDEQRVAGLARRPHDLRPAAFLFVVPQARVARGDPAVRADREDVGEHAARPALDAVQHRPPVPLPGDAVTIGHVDAKRQHGPVRERPGPGARAIGRAGAGARPRAGPGARLRVGAGGGRGEAEWGEEGGGRDEHRGRRPAGGPREPAVEKTGERGVALPHVVVGDAAAAREEVEHELLGFEAHVAVERLEPQQALQRRLLEAVRHRQPPVFVVGECLGQPLVLGERVDETDGVFHGQLGA
jgi:hypothetical protein